MKNVQKMYVVFSIFTKKKRHKIKIFPPKKVAYQPMNMNPYLSFRKAVDFKSSEFA
jgi:hypothetical protein